MKLIIDGYNKTLRKKDNQIVVMEKDNEIYRISANKVSDITIWHVLYLHLLLMEEIIKMRLQKRVYYWKLCFFRSWSSNTFCHNIWCKRIFIGYSS